MAQFIQYHITPSFPEAHLFYITLTIPAVSEQVTLRLPNWIPGSYMIRDFAKNIVQLRASDGKVSKGSKDSWIISGIKDDHLVVEYEVYAWDLSVRAAHVDQTHAYFNGTSVFLEVIGREQEAVLVDIEAPVGEAYKNWRVATSMRSASEVAIDGGAELYGFGLYFAENYDELIDHPVEIADFSLGQFEACGVSHDIVLAGKHYADMPRLEKDLQKLCEYHIRFFGEPAPMERYVFMTYVLGNGFGGLEHRASTSLHCGRNDLPRVGEDSVSQGYRTYLGLCSHEYFHTWNVKRIKPARFLPYDLTQETPTELLWVFEGFTSYFDDLALARTKLIDVKSYLELLAQTITRVWQGAGRHKQTVTESSFDAWSKFYKQDENAPNAIVSYYTKGSLVALALDLKIRKATEHQKCLDDVMRILWNQYGKVGKGVEDDTVQDIVNQLTGEDFTAFFQQALYTTQDLPLEQLLAEFGLQLKFRASTGANDKGGKLDSKSEMASLMVNWVADPLGAKLNVVHDFGCGQKAGLSAGDVVIAVDGIKVAGNDLDNMVGQFTTGSELEIQAFRRDELMSFTVSLEPALATVAYFEPVSEQELSSHAKAWLHL